MQHRWLALKNACLRRRCKRSSAGSGFVIVKQSVLCSSLVLAGPPPHLSCSQLQRAVGGVRRLVRYYGHLLRPALPRHPARLADGLAAGLPGTLCCAAGLYCSGMVAAPWVARQQLAHHGAGFKADAAELRAQPCAGRLAPLLRRSTARTWRLARPSSYRCCPSPTPRARASALCPTGPLATSLSGWASATTMVGLRGYLH